MKYLWIKFISSSKHLKAPYSSISTPGQSTSPLNFYSWQRNQNMPHFRIHIPYQSGQNCLIQLPERPLSFQTSCIILRMTDCHFSANTAEYMYTICESSIEWRKCNLVPVSCNTIRGCKEVGNPESQKCANVYAEVLSISTQIKDVCKQRVGYVK